VQKIAKKQKSLKASLDICLNLASPSALATSATFSDLSAMSAHPRMGCQVTSQSHDDIMK
jgi:hypothetical protein